MSGFDANLPMIPPYVLALASFARHQRQFDENVPHPDGIGLIFYPKIEFKTAEELVDYALAYKHPKA